MIPPLAPGQKDEGQMVGWKNTFNMRQVTLMNLALTNLGARTDNVQHSVTYMQNGCITSPVKSLDILRRNIQNAINKDIDNVIKKYLEKFFQPAVSNIRNNLGRDSVNEDHIKDACCKMLEDAKLMYTSNRSRDSSPYDFSDSDTGSLIEYKFGRPNTVILSKFIKMSEGQDTEIDVGCIGDTKKDHSDLTCLGNGDDEINFQSPLFRKRKGSDTDSEASHRVRQKKLKNKLTLGESINVRRITLKREGPKWNPDRLTTNTLFIMGAKANKVLGFGQTRGRLYVRHPDLIRYSGDQEDKEWLAQNNLMPPTGGKAYLMVLEDIKELTMNDDYRNSPNLQLNELKGFEVPAFMLSKIKNYVENTRTDGKVTAMEVIDFHTSQSMTPPSTALDSAPSTPSDTLQMLECQSASTVSSKHSDTNPFDNIPEMSPGSNHSFISGPFTQSPVPPTQLSVSPSMLANFNTHQQATSIQQSPIPINSGDSNYNNLSVLLASQIASDNSEEQEF